MSKVFFDTGISLDGFVAGENGGPKNPLGDRGMSIHQWMYKEKAFWKSLGMEGGEDDTEDGRLITESLSRAGAYIMGKRMFDEGEVNWPEDLYKAPVYVVTHEKREPWVQKGSTTFYFINSGINEALALAKSSCNGKDIRVQGGANIIQQFLNAGLIDEFTIHIAPVIIGKGIRLFDNLDRAKYKFEKIKVSDSPVVTHLHFKKK